MKTSQGFRPFAEARVIHPDDVPFEEWHSRIVETCASVYEELLSMDVKKVHVKALGKTFRLSRWSQDDLRQRLSDWKDIARVESFSLAMVRIRDTELQRRYGALKEGAL